MRPSKYVLVTPVKDEAATIGRTIESVIAQSLLPQEWVIVSDGSTDRTDCVVLEYAAQYRWIHLIQLPPREARSFAAVVENTERGIAAIGTVDYDFIGLLDADVTFQRDYFEQIINRFASNPRLGLAGGVVIDLGHSRSRFPRNRQDVPGAVQFFRRSCFDSLGGLIAVPEGGWDVLTCAAARMNGYDTQLCTDLVVDHLKPRNISQGGVLRRKWQMGVRDYALGYNPLFEVAKCVGRMRESPLVVGSLAWLVGYFCAALTKRPRVVSPELIATVQREQRQRLSSFRGTRKNAARVAESRSAK